MNRERIGAESTLPLPSPPRPPPIASSSFFKVTSERQVGHGRSDNKGDAEGEEPSGNMVDVCGSILDMRRMRRR